MKFSMEKEINMTQVTQQLKIEKFKNIKLVLKYGERYLKSIFSQMPWLLFLFGAAPSGYNREDHPEQQLIHETW